ncbi:MAG: reverse transcriptase [Bacteroidia bacterium]|nr:reverse transcriptase [Bacteroidia bacterium]
MKEESYCSFELPEYFSFQTLLTSLSKELQGKVLRDSTTAIKPKDVEGVNYTLLNNKDGKFAWRPFQLIHPALYVFLVQEITQENNWKIIQDRFKIFYANEKIECHSIPVAEENEKPDKQNQIYEWWQKVEQRSLALAIEFNHLLHLDITDCYGSLYTHSISWAIHTTEEAKKLENRENPSFIGVAIDKHIQAMSYGQTNGIPQGSALMDFVAEIVLGFGDLLLTEELNKLGITEYKIIRYRDDYRIFTNSPQQSSEIAKVLSDVLSRLNFKINSAKTHATDDVVLGSLKPDKVHWIYNKRKTDNIQQWLIQLYVLGKEYPNSGSLYKETKHFLDWLQFKEKSEEGIEIQSVDVLASILVNLACNNPRLFALVAASLSFLIAKIEVKELQKEMLLKIKKKFSQLPNTSYLNIWLQRLTLKIDPAISYSGKLCEKVIDNNLPIWNSDWLNVKFKKIVEETEIIKNEAIEQMEIIFSEVETDELGEDDKLFS